MFSRLTIETSCTQLDNNFQKHPLVPSIGCWRAIDAARSLPTDKSRWQWAHQRSPIDFTRSHFRMFRGFYRAPMRFPRSIDIWPLLSSLKRVSLGRLPYNRIIENHVSPIDNTSFHVGQSEGKYVSAASSRYFRPYRTDEFTRHVWEYRYRIFTLKFFFTLLKLKYPIACLFFDRIRRSIWSRTRCKYCLDEKKNGTKRVMKSWEIFRTIIL